MLSNIESIILRISKKFKKGNKMNLNDPTRTRTWNFLIRSETLYPLGHEASRLMLSNIESIILRISKKVKKGNEMNSDDPTRTRN